MNQCIEHLQALGLSRNEARIYLSLLRFNPVTGYHLSKQTGIRRSVVYDVLHRLISRGAVYVIAEDPVKYIPVPYDKFLDSVRRDFELSINSIKQELDQASYSSSTEFICHIKGTRNIRKEMKHIVSQAQRELLLELWGPQAEEIKPALGEALERGVKVFTMLFSNTKADLGFTFYHDYMPLEVVEKRLKGRHAIVARDNQEVLIAMMLDEDSSWAVTTRDPALVMVAREYIIHDIMIDLLIREFGKEQLDKVWYSFPVVHSIVLDRLGNAQMQERKAGKGKNPD